MSLHKGEGQVLVSMLNEVEHVIANMSQQPKPKINFLFTKKKSIKNNSYRITIKK